MGLATGAMAQSGAASSAQPLEKGDLAGRSALVWRADNLDPRRYTSFIVEPVEIYAGADADFGGASAAEQRELADFLQSELIRALGDRYPVVSVPSASTARVKVTLAGLENNASGVATVTRILPLGLALNLAKSAAGRPGTFSGSTTIAGQILDSVSAAPLVSFVQKRYPDALDIGSTTDSRQAQRAAITQAADAFRKRLDEIHGGR